MKLTILALLFSLSVSAQSKSDTTIQFNFTKQQWVEIVNKLDKLIDSKSETKSLFELFDKGFKIVADKPKELKSKN